MEERLLYKESLTEIFGRYACRLFLTSPASLFKLLFLRTYGKNRRSIQTTHSGTAGPPVARQSQQSV